MQACKSFLLNSSINCLSEVEAAALYDCVGENVVYRLDRRRLEIDQKRMSAANAAVRSDQIVVDRTEQFFIRLLAAIEAHTSGIASPQLKLCNVYSW